MLDQPSHTKRVPDVCQARALECARKSSSCHSITFDAARDKFKLAHIFLWNRGVAVPPIVRCKCLAPFKELVYRKPSDMELLIFNVLTAVERLFVNTS
jgi:hypothetical protein